MRRLSLIAIDDDQLVLEAIKLAVPEVWNCHLMTEFNDETPKTFDLALVDILPQESPKFNNLRDFGQVSNYYTLLNTKEYQNALVDRLIQTENLLTQAKKLRTRTQVMGIKLRQELGYPEENL